MVLLQYRFIDFTFCCWWYYFSKPEYYIDLIIDLSTNILHMAVKLQILINVDSLEINTIYY